MLVFDEVCNNRVLPLDFLKSGSGNWVLQDKQGLMAISGENFWNNYMFNVRIRYGASFDAEYLKTDHSQAVENIAAGTDCTAVSASASLSGGHFTWKTGRNSTVNYTQYTKDGDWGTNENIRGFVRTTSTIQSDSTTDTGFTKANGYVQCNDVATSHINSRMLTSPLR
jgi:hypothetical protein